ncbi:MAG: hypothetical protein LBC74_12390 [Planctomycetaceae bacterium]|nr:hypothetical protein [Planctomycetaceae bacterium]
MKRPNIEAEAEFMHTTGGAVSRINNFWGGVYKRFYVELPKNEYIVFKVDKNFSLNSTLCGIFVDSVKDVQIDHPSRPFNPPHELTPNWEEVMEDPTNPQLWWAFHAFDQLLYNRDKKPTWYRQYGRKYSLALIRTFMTIKNGLPAAPDGINPIDKERIRADVAKIINDAQLFSISDKIKFRRTKYSLTVWERRTKLDRKQWDSIDWDWDYFKEFNKKNAAQQSW